MQVPSTYKVKTARETRNKMPLSHRHLTTTDFFRAQPVVCRELVPNDSVDVDVTSFVRMFPMPFPVFGRIKYYNRVFFVPYRSIMEGFNNFITDTDYAYDGTFVRIQSAPWFTNNDLASAFLPSPGGNNLSESIDQGFYYRDYDGWSYMVDELGNIVVFTMNDTAYYFGRTPEGAYVIRNENDYPAPLLAFGQKVYGTMTSAVSSDTRTYTITDSFNTATYKFLCTPPIAWDGIWDPSYTPAVSTTPYDQVKYDWLLGSSPMRFTNRGRRFYTLLCSLGYRIDFTNQGGSFIRTQKISAGKLLAWTKIMLDWYEPSQYATSDTLATLFKGVDSSGKHILDTDIKAISELEFTVYDRDYFTSAWNNPSAPNVNDTRVDISDITVTNSQNVRSVLSNSYNNITGSQSRTPTIHSEKLQDGSYAFNSTYPANVSYYILEQLRALTNYTRRHQLSGIRTVDRYLAQFGKKLNDDKDNRCYYIGGYSYDADIMDIMSTADTAQAALGDYAGKGIAYSDAHRNFKFDADEYGYIMVVSSVVPDVGYVQGVMRENYHLDRLSFFNADFDNLGTQAIRHDELFADNGMMKIDGSGIATSVLPPDSVFGFSPRYMEYKVGYDFLTGDFNVPSRREGMDAYHLFRLFKDGNINPINKRFLFGEQDQYDRVFNNTDSDYDHMYIVHNCQINAYRPMKSAKDVYDFEHSNGDEIEIPNNGTQLN